jgi:hypothetical protein
MVPGVFDLAALRIFQHRLVTQDFQFETKLKSEASNFVQEVAENFQSKRYCLFHGFQN